MFFHNHVLEPMNSSYETVYGVQLFDDLHNYLPDVLYNHRRFQNVQGLLDYIHQQTRNHFNLFERGRRMIYPHAPNNEYPRQMNITTTETIDITPMMTIPLNRLNGLNGITRPPTIGRQPTQTNTDTFANLLDMILPQIRERNMEDVVVAPTSDQIESASDLRIATSDQQESEERCSICQDVFQQGQTLRTIVHCEHEFHRACIDRWFLQNVHCPVCRFDIRDHQESPSA